jgi:hypothetical protein
MTRRRGTCVLVGLPPGEFPTPPLRRGGQGPHDPRIVRGYARRPPGGPGDRERRKGSLPYPHAAARDGQRGSRRVAWRQGIGARRIDDVGARRARRLQTPGVPGSERWVDELPSDLRECVAAASKLSSGTLAARIREACSGLEAAHVTPELFDALLAMAGVKGSALPRRMAARRRRGQGVPKCRAPRRSGARPHLEAAGVPREGRDSAGARCGASRTRSPSTGARPPRPGPPGDRPAHRLERPWIFWQHGGEP